LQRGAFQLPELQRIVAHSISSESIEKQRNAAEHSAAQRNAV
jgi:hypothetical protein